MVNHSGCDTLYQECFFFLGGHQDTLCQTSSVCVRGIHVRRSLSGQNPSLGEKQSSLIFIVSFESRYGIVVQPARRPHAATEGEDWLFWLTSVYPRCGPHVTYLCTRKLFIANKIGTYGGVNPNTLPAEPLLFLGFSVAEK